MATSLKAFLNSIDHVKKDWKEDFGSNASELKDDFGGITAGSTSKYENAIASATPGTPTITGAANVGVTLQGATGSWTAGAGGTLSYTYQWVRTISSVDYEIQGANSLTYTLTAADVGATIKFKVHGYNAGGSATGTSTATSAVS